MKNRSNRRRRMIEAIKIIQAKRRGKEIANTARRAVSPMKTMRSGPIAYPTMMKRVMSLRLERVERIRMMMMIWALQIAMDSCSMMLLIRVLTKVGSQISITVRPWLAAATAEWTLIQLWTMETTCWTTGAKAAVSRTCFLFNLQRNTSWKSKKTWRKCTKDM